MTREEFLSELEIRLASMPAEERVAALQYFTMYFDDAGTEHEQDVIAELGTPEKVAREVRESSGGDESWSPPQRVETIKADFAAMQQQAPELELHPQPAPPPQTPGVPPQRYALEPTGIPPTTHEVPPAYGPPPTGQAPPPQAPPPQSGMGVGGILLIVVLCILLSPFLGALICFAAAGVVVLTVPVIIGFSFVASGIALLVVSLYLFLYTTPHALIMLGVALGLIGLGLLLGIGGVWLIAKVVPAIVRGIASLFRKIFVRRQEAY